MCVGSIHEYMRLWKSCVMSGVMMLSVGSGNENVRRRGTFSDCGGGVPVGEFVGVDELSDCCIAFLWGKECKLEVLTEVLLCGVISNSWGPWGQPQMCGEIPLRACGRGGMCKGIGDRCLCSICRIGGSYRARQ